MIAMTARADMLLDQIISRSHAAGTLYPGATAAHLRIVNRMLAMAASEPPESQKAMLDVAVEIVIGGLAPR